MYTFHCFLTVSWCVFSCVSGMTGQNGTTNSKSHLSHIDTKFFQKPKTNLSNKKICGYHFPSDSEYSIVHLESTALQITEFKEFTINYYVKLEDKGNTLIHPLSAIIDTDGKLNHDTSLYFAALNGKSRRSGNEAPLNKWIQITQVWNAKTATSSVYVNGAADSTAQTTWTKPMKFKFGFFLGQLMEKTIQTNVKNRLVGYMSRFQVWDRILKGVELYGLLSGLLHPPHQKQPISALNDLDDYAVVMNGAKVIYEGSSNCYTNMKPRTKGRCGWIDYSMDVSNFVVLPFNQPA